MGEREGGAEVGAFHLPREKGEERVHHTRQVAIVLVCVSHCEQEQSLHSKVKHACMKPSQKPASERGRGREREANMIWVGPKIEREHRAREREKERERE